MDINFLKIQNSLQDTYPIVNSNMTYEKTENR